MPIKRRAHRSIPRIPKSRRFDVSRGEFNHIIDLLNKRGEILHEYRTSLDEMRRVRIASMVSEVHVSSDGRLASPQSPVR